MPFPIETAIPSLVPPPYRLGRNIGEQRNLPRSLKLIYFLEGLNNNSRVLGLLYVRPPGRSHGQKAAWPSRAMLMGPHNPFVQPMSQIKQERNKIRPSHTQTSRLATKLQFSNFPPQCDTNP